MSKGIMKSTIREIRSSFGRYMAILLIVALGVGFFSGLKVSHDAMVYTADFYWDSLNLFDYHLLSSLGFDEDTAASFEKEEGVLAAEGIKSADIIMVEEDGTERIIKTMSVPEKVNQVDLTAGRMPEQDKECLADGHLYNESDIGKTIAVSASNEKEDSDKFAVKEYTIVGLARSPLYALYDRGSTSLGDGVIDGFLYLPDDAYDMDYDTEIYVVLNKDTVIYSDEYDDLTDSKAEEWEEICENAVGARYNRIYTEAMEELADAETTLMDKKAEGEKELRDARDILTDNRIRIADGKNTMGRAKQELLDNEEILIEKEKEYKAGLKAYKKNKADYDKGKKTYDKAVSDYNSQYAAYQKGLAEYNKGKSEYDSSESEYANAKVQYESSKDYLSEADRKEKEQQLAVWRASLDETEKTLSAAKAQLDTAGASFAVAKKTLDTNGIELNKAGKQLDKAKRQLDTAGRQIQSAKEELLSAKIQIAEKEKELLSAEEEIAEGETEYETAESEYRDKIGEAESELADAKGEINDIKKPDIYVLGRETNAGYASFENDSQIVMGVAKVFPIFFFLVAALVCMTTMTRMMEEQRTQIGVLKALGYSNSAIIGKYIIYSGSAATVGAVGGFFAGTWAFSIVIWTAYKMLYDMGPLHYVFNGGLAVISILVALLCSAGTTFVACYQELQEMAASLMRPKPPKTGKRVLLEKIPVVWNHLKFLNKVSVRNLFRYKRRFFMMIIGVSGCTALLVTGMGVRDSIADIADTQFDQISLYDMAVGIKEGEQVEVTGIKDSMLVFSRSADLWLGEKIKSVNLLVPQESTVFDSYIDLHTEGGEPVAFPKDNEVLITAKLAELYNIQIGDTITLQNSELKEGAVTVSGIYITYFNQYMIMAPNTYEQLFDEKAEYNEMYVNLEEGEDAYAVSARLMKDSNVSTLSVSEDVRAQIADMMGSLNYVVILVIFCAALLAFIVIYNLNNINITERIREIATIKVLGFYKEETNSYVFRENIVLTLLGSLAGLVMGHYLHAFVMSQIKIEAVAFAVRITGISFLLSIALTLLFNQIVNLFMSRKLEGIDMAESLKSVE